MGIIAGVLVAANLDTEATVHIPLWVVLACHAAMGLGTLSGGWRIVRTMGHRITRLTPVGGLPPRLQVRQLCSWPPWAVFR
jgi:PiT family inorganic phosphate transporter